MDAKSINSGSPIEESNFSNIEKMLVTVELWQISEQKEGKDYIDIKLKSTGGEYINARQYLNKKEDGKYKTFMYPGNGEILPSISYEMLTLAEATDPKKYAELRAKYPHTCRPLMESLSFEIEVKRVTNKAGEEFLIPMFAYAKQKDQEYQKAEKDNTTQVEKALAEHDPHNLPF